MDRPWTALCKKEGKLRGTTVENSRIWVCKGRQEPAGWTSVVTVFVVSQPDLKVAVSYCTELTESKFSWCRDRLTGKTSLVYDTAVCYIASLLPNFQPPNWFSNPTGSLGINLIKSIIQHQHILKESRMHSSKE
jgi:hypothetical protein